MGQVSTFIREFIHRHLKTYGIVVWYDPQRHYEHLLDEGWENVKVLRYRDSFLRLRREAETALEANSTPQRLGESFPKVLVYVPLSRKDTEHALIELEAAGVTLGPEEGMDTHSDLSCDTSLAALAEEALKEHLPPALVTQIVHDVSEGKLRLAELDNLVRPPEVPVSLSTFYKAQTPEDIALAFVTDEEQDQALKEKHLLPDIEKFFREHFDIQRAPSGDPERLRSVVVAHLLITEAAVSSGNLSAWQGLPVVSSPSAQGLAVKTVVRWRRDRNLTTSYNQWAEKISQDLTLPLKQLDTAQLEGIETFPQTDDLLLEHWANTLAQRYQQCEICQAVSERAAKRQQTFWPQQRPDLAQRWQMLLAAAAVFEQSAKIQGVLRKGRIWKVKELVDRYAEPKGWHLLDRAYRRFEITLDAWLDASPQPTFIRLTSAVRRVYRDTVQRMAERLVTAWERQEFEAAEPLFWQREVFHDWVLPRIQDKKRVAYILVDAFRYELLAEWLEARRGEEDIVQQKTLVPTLGVLPAITVLGMAALLPGAENNLGLTKARGTLTAEVDGHALPTREARIDYLEKRLENVKVRRFTHQKMERFRTISPQDMQSLKESDFLLVTSQEIDQIAENMGPRDAYDQFQRTFRDLVRMLRRLAEAGFTDVFVVADHGFLLFGDALDESEKAIPPSGNTIKVGRRYWIGQKGTPDHTYAYFTAADLELTGDLEFAFPRGAGVFRAAGGHSHYYHGGISLQELVVPLLHLELRKDEGDIKGRVLWRLKPGSQRVTARLLRLSIEATAQELFRSPQRVRLEVEVNGQPIKHQAWGEGCQYNDVLDEIVIEPPTANAAYPPCEITVILLDLPESGILNLALTDADTGARLAGISLPIDVAIR